MNTFVDSYNAEVLKQAVSCIQKGETYEYPLLNPSAENKETLKRIVLEFLTAIKMEKSYNLLCLCLEEIISNSVKANIKRAYFISHNLNINNHEDYEKGMSDFKENGLGKIKNQYFINKINTMGLYVKLYFTIFNNTLNITARNNSVISKEELERINKKLKLSENKSPEDLFMNSIDQTEGAGLGIIMIKKILSQISTAEDSFSIRASDTETITELKISP